MPVDLAAFKKLLPNDSFFEGITFNPQTNEVELRWSNRCILTPFTTHQDFTMEMLQAKELPKCARLRDDAVKEVVPPETPTPPPVAIPVDKKRKTGVKKVP